MVRKSTLPRGVTANASRRSGAVGWTKVIAYLIDKGADVKLADSGLELIEGR